MSQILHKVAPIGEARDREILKDASTYVYARRPQGDALAHLFLPNHRDGPPKSAIVFFHGGFWDSPTPTQFVPHCLHFASRGAVAITAETRTLSKHGTSAVEAIEDARELIRWIRQNADTFNIDPKRIVIGGAGGGALLALLATMPKSKHLPAVAGVDCFPQALILFSALVNSASNAASTARFPDRRTAKRMSPTRLVRRKLPPMLFFHGKSDRITPFAEVEKFRRRLRWRGNSCELIDFVGADHSFFNFNVSHRNFELTILAADRFLVERGFLEMSADTGEF